MLAPTFKAGIKRKKKGVWEFSTGAQHVTPMSAEVSEHLSSSSQLKVILTNAWVSRLLLGTDCHSGLHEAAAGGSSSQRAAQPRRSRPKPRCPPALPAPCFGRTPVSNRRTTSILTSVEKQRAVTSFLFYLQAGIL